MMQYDTVMVHTAMQSYTKIRQYHYLRSLKQTPPMTPEEISFMLANETSDTASLLLGASKYPGIDIPKAVSCIEARRKLRTKIPSWNKEPSLEFPYPLALEQCSSEATAIYKRRFIQEGDTVADLTAGLGVDSFFLSGKAASVECYEHNPVLAVATLNNLRLLRAVNVTLRQGDSRDLLRGEKRYDLIYADPDRRSAAGQRICSVRDCEPDIYAIKEELFRHTGRILLKLSPMADISATTALFPETSQVHVISVDDECKEVLLLLEAGFSGEAVITAADLHIAEGADNDIACGYLIERLTEGTASAEREAVCPTLPPEEAMALKGGYLYEPGRAVVKAGMFRSVGMRHHMRKISANVHLYVSDAQDTTFPGKCFHIGEILPFSGKTLKSLRTICPAASVTAKDFPLTSDQLRIRAGVREDEMNHIFAFRLRDGQKVLALCRRVVNP